MFQETFIKKFPEGIGKIMRQNCRSIAEILIKVLKNLLVKIGKILRILK